MTFVSLTLTGSYSGHTMGPAKPRKDIHERNLFCAAHDKTYSRAIGMWIARKAQVDQWMNTL